MRIVDQFEMIDIDHQHRHGMIKARGASQFGIGDLRKAAPIITARLRVGHCQPLDLIVQARVLNSNRRLVCKQTQHSQLGL